MLAFLLTCLCFLQEPDLSEVNWLLGRWVMEQNSGQQESFEIWKKISDRQFQGIGYTTNGEDTSFVETLEITFENEGFYYIADVPQNPTPVYFRITEMSDTSLVAENPQHDFPQKLIYKKRGDGLHVKISSKEKSRSFAFRKAAAPQ